MKRKFIKVLLILVMTILLGVPPMVAWMRAGEEEPLDYSVLNFELGPRDPEVNGYTYLRQFLETHHANIPEDYPVKYSEDYDILVDYNQYDGWDLEFFEQILEMNREFLMGVEAAFELPEFTHDVDFSPDTLVPVVGQIRSYLKLRQVEARVLCMLGKPEEALMRLADLNEELERLTQSGGALIGILTSVACNGIFTAEIWLYQAHVKLPSEQLGMLGDSYNVGEYYAEAFQVAVGQEFQFLQNMFSEIFHETDKVHKIVFGEESSAMKLFLHELAIYVGLRETRSINGIFRGYAEAAEQVFIPSSQRSFNFSKSLYLESRENEWTRFLNRNPYGESLFSALFPSVEKILSVIDRGEAAASAARISLCLQAYYQETGALPEGLDALVPDYLNAIPKDPFDGEPIRYSREKKIVYSVGDDFVDQGGSEKLFIFQLDPDDDYYSAELDETEPTFPLRFAM